jgi:hypothetical protein
MRRTLRLIWAMSHLLSASAQARLLAADSFSCGGTTQVGVAGGLGFAGPWIADAAEASIFVPANAPLTAPAGLATDGGSLRYNGTPLQPGQPLSSHYGARIYRPLDVSLSSDAELLGLLENHLTFFGNQQRGFGVPGTTVWLGFLLNGGTAGNGLGGVQYLAQIHLYDGLNINALNLDDNNKDGEVLAIGRGNLNVNWNYERTCAHSPCGGVSSSQGYVSSVQMDAQTHWAVMRFDFTSATNTAITFWLDPTPGSTVPLTSTALNLSFNGQSGRTINVPALHFNWIEFGGQTQTFALDELRVADNFVDLSLLAPTKLTCGDVLLTNGFE